MKSFFVVVLAGAAMWLISSPAWAEKAYVTDSVEITFRTGPGTGNKILSFLRSGQEVEVLESRDNWVRVRVPGRGRDTAEGWVLKRYLMRRQPWEARAVSLEKENAALSERLSLAERDREEAARRERAASESLRENMAALRDAREKYAALRRDAAGYLDLKKNYTATREKLEAAVHQVDTLTAENRQLRSSGRNRWFATGALVLLCGLMIGLLVGRQTRKRRSYY